MTITAKYPGTCTKCGGSFQAGASINWEKGRGASHAVCSGRSTKAPTRKAPTRKSSYPASPPEPGAHEIGGRRSGRDDRRYDVGAVVHAPKVGPAGGGPDRHYYTVLASRVSPPNEDNCQFDWSEHAWVRAATDAEAAPVAARLTGAANRKAMLAELDVLARAGWTGSDDEAKKPVGREYVLDAGTHGSGRRVAVLSDDAAAVAVWCSGYYDDYRQTLAVTRDPRAVEIVTKLLGGA